MHLYLTPPPDFFFFFYIEALFGKPTVSEYLAIPNSHNVKANIGSQVLDLVKPIGGTLYLSPKISKMSMHKKGITTFGLLQISRPLWNKDHQRMMVDPMYMIA